MILPIAGVPGRFAERCETMLCAMMAAGDATPAFVNADSLKALGATLLAQNNVHTVAVARRPSPGLAAALADCKRPFVLALEPPEQCVGALMADHGQSFLDAVRTVAGSGAAMLPLMVLPGALVLTAGEWKDGKALATRIATHYGLGATRTVIDAGNAAFDHGPALANMTPPPWQRDTDAAPFTTEIETLLPPLLAGACGPIWRSLTERTGSIAGALSWHRDLFLCGDPPAPPPAVIDVTGPGRGLFYGPYIHLPAGSWSCALMLGCSPEAVGLTLVAEIAAGAVVGRANVTVTEPGFFEIEFSCILPATDQPVEIRLFSAHAAFEGHLALIQATMTPLKAVRVPVTIL